MSEARLTELLEIITPLLKTVSAAPADQATTAAYVDVAGSKMDAFNSKYIGFTCKNTHAANSIKWKVLMSMDDVTYVEAQAEAVLAALAVGTFVASATQIAYRYFKVQVLDSVGGTHGTAQVRGYGKS